MQKKQLRNWKEIKVWGGNKDMLKQIDNYFQTIKLNQIPIK